MSNARSAHGAQLIPLDVVGSTVYGRYPEISVEETFNMLIADDALIPFAGYKFRQELGGIGRGLYSSLKANLLFAVSDNFLYKLNVNLTPSIVGTLSTIQGDVFISEDILNNIALCDKQNLYIYNYLNGDFYIPGTSPYGSNVTNGNGTTITQSGNTVTGIGTTFTSSMVGGTIYFGGSSRATITGFIDATHITVSVSQTLSAQQYLIVSPLDFIPNNVTFQDGRFIVTSSALTNGTVFGQWRLSDIATVTVGSVTTTYITFPATAQKTGLFQTKADLPLAPVTFPGRGNLLFIMGSSVTEPWTDYGLAVFPYQKSTSYNIDFGCINPATIAYLDNIVVWVGYNEKSGLVIMYTTGSDIKSISTDGINYKLANLVSPSTCYGMSFKQDGHLIYIVTFYDPSDNLSIAYDFTTGKFYTITDEEMNYYVAKRIVFFNDKYYFISINDGDLYEVNSEFYTYLYADNLEYEIPMIRLTSTKVMPNLVPTIANNLSLIVEQGVDPSNDQSGNKINSVNVNLGGTGYTAASVVVTGDGVGASLTPIIAAGSITSCTVNNGGVGYTYAYLTVDGDGSGADLSANVGSSTYYPRIALSVSYDGGHLWSSFVEQPMNRTGDYLARNVFYDLGYSNKFTFQFRFYTKYRAVIKDGNLAVYV